MQSPKSNYGNQQAWVQTPCQEQEHQEGWSREGLRTTEASQAKQFFWQWQGQQEELEARERMMSDKDKGDQGSDDGDSERPETPAPPPTPEREIADGYVPPKTPDLSEPEPPEEDDD